MTRARRIAAGLALAALSGVAGAALWDRHRPAPAQTTLMLSTCGLVRAPDPIALPLAELMAQAAAPGLVLGPILHPGLDGPLSIRFDPLAPGASGPVRPHRDGGVLVLPVRRDRLPEAIRLACRHGRVAEARYRHGAEWTAMAVPPGGVGAALSAPPPPAAPTPDRGARAD